MEEIIRSIDSIQIEMEAIMIGTQHSLKELRLKAATLETQNRNGNDLDDNRFTYCTIRQLGQAIDNDDEVPKVCVIKDQEDKIQEELLVVTAGTDGSVRSRRGRRASAAAVHFGDGSPLNSAKTVLSASSSMVPEVDAFIELLYTARREKVKRLAAVIDNEAAISFIECSAKTDILNSRVMQQYLLHNPALESRANMIRDLMPHFSIILTRWQKAHTTSTSIFANLNRAADAAAKQRADKILN